MSGADRDGSGRRVIQPRDRLAFALVGMCRVARASTIHALAFAGRDETTWSNRMRHLARADSPIGAFWVISRMTRPDGSLETYLSLTEEGYRQAEVLLGRGWFVRKPTEPLRANHVEHDLDLADFMLALLPREPATYQPKLRGKAYGPPLRVEAPTLPQRWRIQHWSIFKRIAVFDGARNEAGAFVEKPHIKLQYTPDAILETHSLSYTRYLIEWDRGTEPLVTGRDQTSIQDKLERYIRLVWEPWDGDRRRPGWHQRPSWYLRIFPGAELLRPKLVILTSSAQRAANIMELACRMLSGVTKFQSIERVVDVSTVEQARKKFVHGLPHVEAAAPSDVRPWVAEAQAYLGKVDQVDAEVARVRKEQADRKAREAAAAAEAKARAKTAITPIAHHVKLPIDLRSKLPRAEQAAIEELRPALERERMHVEKELEEASWRRK